MLSINAARPASAAAEREPRIIDRARQRDQIRSTTVPNTTARAAAHHDRAWWRLEARRVGSDWPAVLALHAAVVAAWRARQDKDAA